MKDSSRQTKVLIAFLIIISLSFGQPGLLFAVSEAPLVTKTESKDSLSALREENKNIEKDIEKLRKQIAEKKKQNGHKAAAVQKKDEPKQGFFAKLFGVKPKTAEEKAKEEQLKKEKKLKEVKLKQQREAEKKAKAEAARKKRDAEKAKRTAEKKAKEEAERKKKAAEKVKKEAEKKAKEEAARKKKALEKAKKEAEKKAKETARKKRAAEKAKEEAEKKAKEEAAKKKRAAEKAKKEAEKKAKKEADRKKKAVEKAKKAAEKKRKAELAKQKKAAEKPEQKVKEEQGFLAKLFGVTPKTPEEKAKEEALKKQKALEKEKIKKQKEAARKQREAEKKRKRELEKQKKAEEKKRREAARKADELAKEKKKAEEKAAREKAKKKLEAAKKQKELEKARKKEAEKTEAAKAKAAPVKKPVKKPEAPKTRPTETKPFLAEPVKRLTDLGLSFSPVLQMPANLVGEAPPSHMITIKDALERSVAVSLPKDVAEKKKSLYQRNFIKAIRDLFPEAKFYYDWEGGRITGGHFKSMEYAFEMKQPVFKGFALVNTVLQEKYNRQASEEEIRDAVNEAIYEALLSYFELTRATLVYQSHARLEEQAQKYVKMSGDKKKQGLISEIEHLNVQSIYADIASEKEILHGDKEIADLELKKALRIPPQEMIKILPLYDYTSADLEAIDAFGQRVEQESSQLRLESQTTLDEYLVIAYQNRAALKMEESKLIANRYSEKVTKGKWLPDVEMNMLLGETSQYMRAKTEPTAPPFRPDWMINVIAKWNMGGNTAQYEFKNRQTAPSVTEFRGGGGTQKWHHTFTYNLLDGLQQYADTKQAELDTLEQLQAYDETERQVVQEVVESFYNYRAAVARLRSASKGLDYRKRSTELSKLKLDKNEIEISEYLESLRDLASQKNDFHDAMADYFFSKADLNHAVGIQNFVPIQKLTEPMSQQGSES